jgi:hypothetical protein
VFEEGRVAPTSIELQSTIARCSLSHTDPLEASLNT